MLHLAEGPGRASFKISPSAIDHDAIFQQCFSVRERLAQIVFFELRVLAKEIRARRIRSKSLEHAPHGDAKIADARLPSKTCGVGGDAIELHHVKLNTPPRRDRQRSCILHASSPASRPPHLQPVRSAVSRGNRDHVAQNRVTFVSDGFSHKSCRLGSAYVRGDRTPWLGIVGECDFVFTQRRSEISDRTQRKRERCEIVGASGSGSTVGDAHRNRYAVEPERFVERVDRPGRLVIHRDRDRLDLACIPRRADAVQSRDRSLFRIEREGRTRARPRP